MFCRRHSHQTFHSPALRIFSRTALLPEIHLHLVGGSIFKSTPPVRPVFINEGKRVIAIELPRDGSRMVQPLLLKMCLPTNLPSRNIPAKFELQGRRTN